MYYILNCNRLVYHFPLQCNDVRVVKVISINWIDTYEYDSWWMNAKVYGSDKCFILQYAAMYAIICLFRIDAVDQFS